MRRKKIKLRNLTLKTLAFFKEKVQRQKREVQPERGIWDNMKETLMTAAIKTVGRTKGRKRKVKEKWWWNEEVQYAIRTTDLAYKERKTTEADQARKQYNRKNEK